MKYTTFRQVKSTLGLLFLVFLCFGCSDLVVDTSKCGNAEAAVEKAHQQYQAMTLQWVDSPQQKDALIKAIEVRQEAEEKAFLVCNQLQ